MFLPEEVVVEESRDEEEGEEENNADEIFMVLKNNKKWMLIIGAKMLQQLCGQMLHLCNIDCNNVFFLFLDYFNDNSLVSTKKTIDGKGKAITTRK